MKRKADEQDWKIKEEQLGLEKMNLNLQLEQVKKLQCRMDRVMTA